MISVTYTGNGIAYVTNYDPDQGEIVTLYCLPAEGETLLDVYAIDLTGHSIALGVVEEQTITYNYNGMKITVEFSGTSPVEPFKDHIHKKMPIWMYPVIRQRR